MAQTAPNPNTLRNNGNFVTKMGSSLTRWSLKYMPDPSILAVVLTLIAFLLGMFVAKQTPLDMVKNWYKGFWELLAFAMQMALIVITGSAVADAPIVKKGIMKLASRAKTGAQAAFLVTFVSVLVSFLHWGLSLIVGALLAKELTRQLRIKKIPFEYGLIAAGAYVGQMTWHGALSTYWLPASQVSVHRTYVRPRVQYRNRSGHREGNKPAGFPRRIAVLALSGNRT